MTNDKIKNVNLLDPLPYEEPKVNDLEVVGEEIIKNETSQDTDINLPEEPPKDDEGQTSLF